MELETVGNWSSVNYGILLTPENRLAYRTPTCHLDLIGFRITKKATWMLAAEFKNTRKLDEWNSKLWDEDHLVRPLNRNTFGLKWSTQPEQDIYFNMANITFLRLVFDWRQWTLLEIKFYFYYGIGMWPAKLLTDLREGNSWKYCISYKLVTRNFTRI